MKKLNTNKLVFFIPILIELGADSLQTNRHKILSIHQIANSKHIGASELGFSKGFLYLSQHCLIGLYFNIESIAEKTKWRFFSNNVFSIQENFEFELNWNQGRKCFQIESGVYQLKNYKAYYCIDFFSLDKYGRYKVGNLMGNPKLIHQSMIA